MATTKQTSVTDKCRTITGNQKYSNNAIPLTTKKDCDRESKHNTRYFIQKNPPNTNKSLELISKLKKDTECKINVQKPTALLYLTVSFQKYKSGSPSYL